MNLQLDDLRKGVASRCIVYCYVITSIKYRNGQFFQTGCAPNFQGDLVTLCTCKHYMRTFLDVNDWKDKWIAGFTGSRNGQKNFLVFLMRVSNAFKSHSDLWFSKFISSETKQAKAAHLDKFGDIYKPWGTATDEFDQKNYFPPCSKHCHDNGWDKDVSLIKRNGYKRIAALLAGDPEHSFLWDRPKIWYSYKLHRGQKKCELDDLLIQLRAYPNKP